MVVTCQEKDGIICELYLINAGRSVTQNKPSIRTSEDPREKILGKKVSLPRTSRT